MFTEGWLQLLVTILALRRLILRGRRPTISLLSSSSASTTAAASGWAAQYSTTNLDHKRRWKWQSEKRKSQLLALSLNHVTLLSCKLKGTWEVLFSTRCFPTCSFLEICRGLWAEQRVASRWVGCVDVPLWNGPRELVWAPPPPDVLEISHLGNTESLGTSESTCGGEQRTKRSKWHTVKWPKKNNNLESNLH